MTKDPTKDRLIHLITTNGRVRNVAAKKLGVTSPRSTRRIKRLIPLFYKKLVDKT